MYKITVKTVILLENEKNVTMCEDEHFYKLKIEK